MASMTRSQYQKFRRTAGSIGSLSNYAATLQRKQTAAEDDYYDNAYKSGVITAEQYITNLNQRLVRTYLSPLQKQNLEQKRTEVQETYQDSLIETAYKTGSTYNGQVVDTKFMAERERAKLNTMVPGSEAYNKQQARIQSFEEKLQSEEAAAGRSERRSFRAEELNKLSTMREESAVELRAKAQIYEKLEAMALADGELEEARSYQTSRNNYNQAADKADVNQRIQDVVIKNSTPIDPMTSRGATAGSSGGVASRPTQPSAPSQQSASTNSGVGTSSVAPASQPPGDMPVNPEIVSYLGVSMDKRVYEELKKKPDVQAYLSRIQNYQRQITGDEGKNNGLNLQINQQQDLVNVYKQELDNAAPDQKDQLIQGYNNAVERLNNLVASREEKLSRIEEEQGGIADFIAKKAVSIMKDQDSEFEREVTKNITTIQDKFSAGKMSIEDYVKEMYNLHALATQMNASRKEQYDMLGDETGVSNADKRMAEYGDKLDIIGTEIQPKMAAGVLRLVQVDEDNKDTLNLSKLSRGVRKGEFILADPTADAVENEKSPEQAIKEWESQHAQVGGKWYSVRPNIDSAPPDFKTPEAKAEYAKQKNEFYFTKIADGKEEKVPIKAINYGDAGTKYVPTAEVAKYVNNGYYKQQGDQLIRNYDKQVSVPWEATKNIVKEIPTAITKVPEQLAAGGKGFLNIAKNFFTGKMFDPAIDAIGSKLPGSYDANTDTWSPFKKDTSSNQSFIQKAMKTVAPPVYASDQPTQAAQDDSWVNDVANRALAAVPERSRQGAQENIPYIVKALDEQGILNPQSLAYALATVQHETAGTFKPIEEFGGRMQAKKLGYSGGENYYGRGYIQLTHDYNYKDIGNKIGMGNALYEDPTLALRPDVAAKILAVFMKERGVTKYTDKGDFIGARKPINGRDKADKIANYANAYLTTLPANLKPAPKVANTKAMQATQAVQYQPKPEPVDEPNFIERAMNLLRPPQAKASEPNMSMAQPKQQNMSVAPAPKQNMSVAPKINTAAMSVQPKAPATSGKPLAPMSYAKPYTPAPAPAPKPAPAPAPKPSFVEQAKNVVKNVVSSVTNLFKRK